MKQTLTSLSLPFRCLPFFFLFFFLFLSHANSQLYDQEHSILMELKQYLQNPPFLSHWTPNSPNSSHCSWPEITCTNDSVTRLSLVNKNITQSVPPFICYLKNLTHIDFLLNYFPGEFPKSLYNCSKLEYLDLSQNYFVGKIPDDIDRLGKLQFLGLGANNFSGDIPTSIGRLKGLKSLHLYQCLFNGSFPPEIGSLSNLEELKFQKNLKLLPSQLPFNFTQLRKLKILWMSETNLIGEIPEMIGNMVALEELDLANNELTGKIPSSLFMLKNLSIVYLHNNKLFGDLPVVIEALNLTILDVSGNSLTGKVPEDFGKLEKLTGLALFFNQLSGELPESLGRLPSLMDFNVFNNNFSGPLPRDFGRYSMLRLFQISTNGFTGRLPEHLCYNGKLRGLVAFDNNLRGELPTSLENCNSLEVLMIYNNGFSSNIPGGLWTSLNLHTFMVSNNNFTGEIPEKISEKISRLEINNNQFSGRIPAGVSSWKNLVVFIASNNLFNGTVPQELTALAVLETLKLDQNHLTGSLPSEITSWESLATLNLGRNQLSGGIPEEIGKLPRLKVLDLSNNQLSGPIPPQLGTLVLTNLNLSSNLLTGSIPSKFDNSAYATSFLNNSGLCATNPATNLNSCDRVEAARKNSSKGLSESLALILSMVILASLVLLLSALLVIRIYRRRRQGIYDSTWKFTSFQKLNFTETNILSGLTDSNMIGSGGSGKVYRVAINRIGGDLVAVKKIWSNRKLDNRLDNEFLAEVKILSTIRHTNIVKLLCCFSDKNSKLLVYEYVENHSLDRWLHMKRMSSDMLGSVHHVVLDWPKRLHIAVGAAQGLCYLHHYCSPPIVHRDIKSSNILLDSEFNAKIADFGLAKILISPGEQATMSSVAGSFGYIAPEYAQTTKVNEKIDVYSFGVILLELATGKQANYGDEHSSLSQWAWRHSQEGNPIADALDEDIQEPCFLDQMCGVFRLGVLCTAEHPLSRPSMTEVLQMLFQLSSPLVYGKMATKSECKIDVVALRSSEEETGKDGH